MPEKDSGYEFDVAISYESSQSDYVNMVYRYLSQTDLAVFYDKARQDIMVSSDLKAKLFQIYRTESDICVLFVTSAYLLRENTMLEARSAIANTRNERNRLIVVNFTYRDTIKKLPDNIVYLDGNHMEPDEVAGFIIDRYEQNREMRLKPQRRMDVERRDERQNDFGARTGNRINENHGVAIGSLSGGIAEIHFHTKE